jgi:hypothetical protein
MDMIKPVYFHEEFKPSTTPDDSDSTSECDSGSSNDENPISALNSGMMRQVRFSNLLRVILIPTRVEVINKVDLYWRSHEIMSFRAEATRDIETYAALRGISLIEAQYELFQQQDDDDDNYSPISRSTSTLILKSIWMNDKNNSNEKVIAPLISNKDTTITEKEVTLIEHNCQLNCDTCKLPCLLGINEAFW